MAYDTCRDHRRRHRRADSGERAVAAGIEVAVYEAAAELREIGAGVALHPNAMSVLRAIGVEDDVREGRGTLAVAGDVRLRPAG